MAPLLARVEERLLAIAAGSGPVLSDHATGTMTAGGKRLRPLLVVLAAGAPTAPGVVRGAVAVELVHAATLVHDDILDAAALRRGRPTVVAAGGRDIAVATGDLLFARAFTELLPSGVEAVRALSEAGSALAEGELLQRADAFDQTVSVERYLRRCELKTACLFVAACRLGSLEAGGDGRRARAVRPRHRPRVPDPRRRARRLGPRRANRQAPRHGPARRDGHAAVHPRA